MIDILERDGLSVELLSSLSYKSELGISLKKNLHYFDRDLLLAELFEANEWYQSQSALVDLPIYLSIGAFLRMRYEAGLIHDEAEFRRELADALSGC